MRWVKLTFPPRRRARWLLITMRLSAMSLAGTARTDVAVGTVSDASMLLATRAGTPRSGFVPDSGATGVGLGLGCGCAARAGAVGVGRVAAAAASVVGVTGATGVGVVLGDGGVAATAGLADGFAPFGW